MEQHLRSEYHAAAAGGRLYAFVNAMHAAGICCKKQRCEENIYQFRFYAKHRKAVEQLAQTYHVQLTLTPEKHSSSYCINIVFVLASHWVFFFQPP